MCVCVSMAQEPVVGQVPLINEASRSHSNTPHSENSSRRMISPTQIFLPDNPQHPQQTNSHYPGGIRTRNPSKFAAADPRFRPRGFWDRWYIYISVILLVYYFIFRWAHNFLIYPITSLADNIQHRNSTFLQFSWCHGTNNCLPYDCVNISLGGNWHL